MENISNELMKKIIAAYYGCPIQFKHQFRGEEFVIITEYSVTVGGTSFSYTTEKSQGSHHGLCDRDHKLILSRLSSITDEHAIEVAKMLSYHPSLKDDWENIKDDFDAVDVVRTDDYVEVLYTHICFVGSLRIHYNLTISVCDEDGAEKFHGIFGLYSAPIDYLRSVGYDLGYGSIQSLIESGIAIEKK